ncbi:DrmE family protein [Haloarchaeobius sp. FL176]|uniref:DrmE family protein n=1 Tax=Haloarchaeobius sp. FL176 TaxID=2967129 RepID=UPI0021484699|nr:DrmE family protein [Haloarchaeobius sp. FL176]
MTIDSIAEHAQSCLDRRYLDRWFPANITTADGAFSFGQTELAVVEESLRKIELGHSLLIHDPIPSNRVPLAVCLAYVRTQDPRFPTDGIIGGNKSLLCFPALHHGYVSQLDEFRRDSIGDSPRLISREPIDRLSQIDQEADIYTAKNSFEIDTEHPGDSVGAVFVDLRKPEWGSFGRRFDEIMALYEATSCPFIFYTDEMTAEAEAIDEKWLTVQITNELLTTAEPDTIPENPSLTTRFEHLINTSDVVVEQRTIGYPELYQIVSDLSAMQNDIQSMHHVQGVLKMEVGWLFNLLTRLPVKPEYWDSVVADNYYQQGVRELLENLRGKAQRLDGRAADVLINYCEAADALHGRLNRSHPLQEHLFELITTGESSQGGPRIVVVRNDFEHKAILQAITLEDRKLADSVSIKTVDEVEPTPNGEIIVARPLDADSYLYDFPTAERIVFLQFEPWAPIVEERLAEGMANIGATISTQDIGQVGGRSKPQEASPARSAAQSPQQSGSVAQSASQSPPSESAESIVDTYERPDNLTDVDPTEALRQDFEGGDSSGMSSTSSTSDGQTREPGLEVELSNGETRKLSSQSRVSVLKGNGDIARKRSEDLTAGETLLLLDSAADDIYDLFVESAHDQEQLRKAESVVERWRTILDDALSADMSQDELLSELQERGSDISDVSTVSNWRTGDTIGPRDPEDVRRVLAVCDPEMEPTAEATAGAMKRIRTEHQKIGRQAREAIEAQMSSSIAGDLTTDLPAGVDQASENVQKATIEAVKSISE